MEPRALGKIVQVPQARRAGILAEGLGLLMEHIRQMAGSADALQESGHPRGANVLDMVRAEETAKVLIIVDLMRLGWTDNALASRQLKYFYDHVARGVYCWVHDLSPATFFEVRTIVDDLRRSHFLDGPNGDDWIFRSLVESEREEAIYVDYIEDEDGCRWVTPRREYHQRRLFGARATRLVMAMDRLGLLTEAGLDFVQAEWNGFKIRDGLHWVAHEAKVEEALGHAADQGLFSDEATQKDLQTVHELWMFPLGTLELRKEEVLRELRSSRDSGLARGPLDRDLG
jgi:hypothetical protein